jgi:hypothetical protein
MWQPAVLEVQAVAGGLGMDQQQFDLDWRSTAAITSLSSIQRLGVREAPALEFGQFLLVVVHHDGVGPLVLRQQFLQPVKLVAATTNAPAAAPRRL